MTDHLPEPVEVRPAPTHPDLRTAIVRADERRQDLAAQGDYPALARGREEVKALRQDLAVLERATTADLARLMPQKWVPLEGLGTLERKPGGYQRTWDWEALLPALIRTVLDPDGTGELPDPSEVMERMKRLIVDVIGVTPSDGPRMGAKKDTPDSERWSLRGLLGPDADDEYATKTERPQSVQLHKGDSK